MNVDDANEVWALILKHRDFKRASIVYTDVGRASIYVVKVIERVLVGWPKHNPRTYPAPFKGHKHLVFPLVPWGTGAPFGVWLEGVDAVPVFSQHFPNQALSSDRIRADLKKPGRGRRIPLAFGMFAPDVFSEPTRTLPVLPTSQEW
ncbi:hypothetical protein [Rhodococcus rhodochrous]|uniref:hypothetical protein n=1 Tax=Rhodococcus rhodochrous TaxID=1829 RepID=UPI0024BAE30D|nr:hypothetical protein [Rhodococcus rhodochrous]MDJ0398846.1 hypothetical protein [Rhodococcus rhodochrous]